MKSSIEFKKNEQKLNAICRLIKSKEQEKVYFYSYNNNIF